GITAVRPRPAPQRGPGRTHQGDARAHHVAVLLRTDKPEPDPVTAIADVVDQQARRTGIVDDDDVGVSIVVDVAECRAAADFDQIENGTRAAGDVLEAGAYVVKQLVSLSKRKRIILVTARGVPD